MTSFRFTTLRSLGIISGLCLAMLAPSIASAILIDNFTDSAFVSRAANLPLGTTTNAIEVGLAGVINGGNRQISVTTVSKTSVSPFDTTSLGIFGGGLSFSNSPGVLGKFTLAYTNIAPVDASAANSALSFVLTNNDKGGTFMLTLSDGTDTASDTSIVPDAQLGQLSFLINPANYSMVDLNALTSITLMYTSAAEAGDLSLINGINLTSVPEPSSLAIALTGLGLAGVYFRRRRKQLTA